MSPDLMGQLFPIAASLTPPLTSPALRLLSSRWGKVQEKLGDKFSFHISLIGLSSSFRSGPSQLLDCLDFN